MGLLCALLLSVVPDGTSQPQGAAGRTVGQRLADDLRWTQAEREYRFAHMDEQFPVNRIAAGDRVHRMQVGRPLRLGLAVDRIFQQDHMAGLLVLLDGRVRYERYGLGVSARTRWTSFSMAKSVTSTLVGAAVQDGTIRSLQDSVATYLPEMRGTAYEDVTVQQLLTMTSGVRWVEDYSAPDSDNVKLYGGAEQPGKDLVVEYMRRLPREAAPGTKWVYNTGETDLTGVLVQRATGKSLSAYLQQKIWGPFGMERDANWIAESRLVERGTAPDGQEFGGSGLSATLRDWGRFGEFVRLGGAAGDQAVLPAGWIAAATRTQEPTGMPGRGYGYQWWTWDDGSYAALGIFGQSMLVDPKRRVVVVQLSAWPQATSAALVADRSAVWAAVRAAVDAASPEPNAPR